MVDLALQASAAPVVVLLAAVAAVAGLAYRSSRTVVKEGQRRVLTSYGSYQRVLEPGTHYVLPFVTNTYPFHTEPRTREVPSQEVITRDNERVTVSAEVRYSVTDAEKAFLEVDDHDRALVNLAKTTTRAVVGDVTADEAERTTLELEAEIRRALHDAAVEWGLQIEAIENLDVERPDQ